MPDSPTTEELIAGLTERMMDAMREKFVEVIRRSPSGTMVLRDHDDVPPSIAFGIQRGDVHDGLYEVAAAGAQAAASRLEALTAENERLAAKLERVMGTPALRLDDIIEELQKRFPPIEGEMFRSDKTGERFAFEKLDALTARLARLEGTLEPGARQLERAANAIPPYSTKRADEIRAAAHALRAALSPEQKEGT